MQGAQPGLEFLQREGFDHVIVGAVREAAQDVVERVARGEHQHGHAVARVAQRAAQVQAIELRQAQVEDDRVESTLSCARQSPRAVAAMVDFVPAPFEEIPDVGGDVVLVLDQEHAHAGGGEGGHAGKRATRTCPPVNEWLSHG